jgi:hypothetical protein
MTSPHLTSVSNVSTSGGSAPVSPGAVRTVKKNMSPHLTSGFPSESLSKVTCSLIQPSFKRVFEAVTHSGANLSKVEDLGEGGLVRARGAGGGARQGPHSLGAVAAAGAPAGTGRGAAARVSNHRQKRSGLGRLIRERGGERGAARRRPARGRPPARAAQSAGNGAGVIRESVRGGEGRRSSQPPRPRGSAAMGRRRARGRGRPRGLHEIGARGAARRRAAAAPRAGPGTVLGGCVPAAAARGGPLRREIKEEKNPARARRR